MSLKVVIGLSGANAKTKIEKGEIVETGLTNNNLIPNAGPMALLVHDKTAALSSTSAKAKKSHSPEDYAAAEQAEKEFDLAIFTASMFVQGVADANPVKAEQIILSAGFRTRKKSQSKQKPETSVKVEAIFTNEEQSILLKWKNAKYARFYEVYMSINPQGEWKLLDSIEGRQMLVEALVSGTRYYFRIVSRNRAGKSVPSQIVSQLAA